VPLPHREPVQARAAGDPDAARGPLRGRQRPGAGRRGQAHGLDPQGGRGIPRPEPAAGAQQSAAAGLHRPGPGASPAARPGHRAAHPAAGAGRPDRAHAAVSAGPALQQRRAAAAGGDADGRRPAVGPGAADRSIRAARPARAFAGGGGDHGPGRAREEGEQGMEPVPSKQLTRAAAAYCLVALVACGCAGGKLLNPDRTASSGDAPATIAVAWNNKVTYAPDPTRGGAEAPYLMARMYLFQKDPGWPLLCDGSVIVDLYDATPREPGAEPKM